MFKKWLTFGLSSEQEDRYRKACLDVDLKAARTVILLSLLPAAVFAINDYSFLGLSWRFYALSVLRVAFVVGGLLLVRLTRRAINYRTYDKAEFAWAILLVVLLIIISATRPQGFIAHSIVAVVVMFVALLSIPNRFECQLAISLSVLIGETLIIAPAFRTMPQATLSVIVSLFLASAVAIASSHNLHAHRRQGFLAWEREQAAFAAAEREEARFRHLFDGAADAVCVHDQQGRIVDVNQVACDSLGYTREELIQLNVCDIELAHQLPHLTPLWEKISTGGSATVEGILRRRDGSTFPAEIHIARFASGERPLFFAAVRDITARKQAEEKLAESEEKFRKAFMTGLDAFYIATAEEGIAVECNNEFASIFGYTRDEVLGKTSLQLNLYADPEDRARVLSMLQAKGHVKDIEVKGRRKDGAIIDVSYSASLISIQGKQHILGVLRDITEHRQLEEQVRQSQKMETIGQLAGGIAHYFNNMLTVIGGYSEMLLMRKDSLPADVREGLKEVAAAASSAANLTRQLLTFSRKQVMLSQPLDLNKVIGNLTRMLNRIIGENIQLHCIYANPMALVQADIGMMEQMLVNLVVNARDAMPNGGELLITTERVHLDEHATRKWRDRRVGDFVCLSVRDTGTGIAAEHLPRVFEPFFTTKGVGKGTGMGLSTVYGVVHQHQGWAEVSSHIGFGTTIKVFLPVLESAEIEPMPESTELKLRGGSEKILLVEDDALVRKLLSRILASYGYRLQEAASGREALDIWQNAGGEFDLLITDVIMPGGVSGRELAEKLRAQQPTLKIILMSGYSADVSGKGTDYLQRLKARFLQKPCSTNTLIQTVRELLDSQ